VFPIGTPPRRTSDRPLLERGHGKADLRCEPDLVADLDVLPLGHDPIRAVDVAADQVFEEVVAVEPAAPLSKLGDPRPDLAGRGSNGDCPGCGDVGVLDQIIAGKLLLEFLVRRAPPELPPPRKEGVGSHGTSYDAEGGEVSRSHQAPPLDVGIKDRVSRRRPLGIGESRSGFVVFP